MFNLGEGHDQGKIFLVSALQGITGLVGKLLCIGGSHNRGLGIVDVALGRKLRAHLEVDNLD